MDPGLDNTADKSDLDLSWQVGLLAGGFHLPNAFFNSGYESTERKKR